MANFTKSFSCVALGGLAIAMSGCATAPPAPRFWLAGTSWAVDGVNRIDTSTRTDFTVHFTDRTFDARFGCQRATGTYTIRYASNGDPVPIFDPSNGVVSGKACTGSPAETLGAELITRSSFSLDRAADGRVVMSVPPTFIALRPLMR